jgi:hypothetical protein
MVNRNRSFFKLFYYIFFCNFSNLSIYTKVPVVGGHFEVQRRLLDHFCVAKCVLVEVTEFCLNFSAFYGKTNTNMPTNPIAFNFAVKLGQVGTELLQRVNSEKLAIFYRSFSIMFIFYRI